MWTLVKNNGKYILGGVLATILTLRKLIRIPGLCVLQIGQTEILRLKISSLRFEERINMYLVKKAEFFTTIHLSTEHSGKYRVNMFGMIIQVE